MKQYTSLGWTPAGTRVWTWSSSYNGGTLNGTPFAYVASATTGTSTTTGQLTSAIFNLSSYTEVYIKFEQYKSLSLGTAKVEISNDGTTWYTLYTNTAAVGSWNTNNPDVKNILVPSAYLTSTARFRFNVSFEKNQGYWAVDNVEINGTVFTPYNWLSFDGVSTLSGALTPSNTALVNVDYDANGLVVGVYNADIRVSSTDPYHPVINLPVKLSVSNTVIPGTPSNVVTSISGSNLVVDWAVSANATSYDVYSSDTPYGTFTFLTNVTTNQYTAAYTAAKKFYYVVAKNATKIEK